MNCDHCGRAIPERAWWCRPCAERDHARLVAAVLGRVDVVPAGGEADGAEADGAEADGAEVVVRRIEGGGDGNG